jgi:hypothetical protein
LIGPNETKATHLLLQENTRPFLSPGYELTPGVLLPELAPGFFWTDVDENDLLLHREGVPFVLSLKDRGDPVRPLEIIRIKPGMTTAKRNRSWREPRARRLGVFSTSAGRRVENKDFA